MSNELAERVKELEAEVQRLNEKIDFLKDTFSNPNDDEDAFKAIIECPYSDFNHLNADGCPACEYYENQPR